MTFWNLNDIYREYHACLNAYLADHIQSSRPHLRYIFRGRRGLFLRPPHVCDCVKEGYFFVPRYEVWGSRSPYTPQNIHGSDAKWLPKWLGFRVCCSLLLFSKSGVLDFVHNLFISSRPLMSLRISLENQGSERCLRRPFFRGACLSTIGINKSETCVHASLTSRQFKTGDQSTVWSNSVSSSLL